MPQLPQILVLQWCHDDFRLEGIYLVADYGQKLKTWSRLIHTSLLKTRRGEKALGNISLKSFKSELPHYAANKGWMGAKVQVWFTSDGWTSHCPAVAAPDLTPSSQIPRKCICTTCHELRTSYICLFSEPLEFWYRKSTNNALYELSYMTQLKL